MNTAVHGAERGSLVVAISSRALFDLGESHDLFERNGVEAFARHQIEREDELLAPGIAIAWVMIAVNLAGDGLRDRLDPKLHGKM